MKTVLVTGATGALGLTVVARFRRDDNWRVLATSRHCHDKDSSQLDVLNREQIFSAISDNSPDLVVHLAATFSNDFDDAYAINVNAARHLLDAVQQFQSRTRTLLIGSAAEYGVVRPEENPIRVNRVLNPVSIYGLTKAWQTQLAGLYARSGVDVVVARIFNLEGPMLSERLFVGRLQKQIDDVLAGRKSVIELGPLTAIRDYVTTTEAAEQLFSVAVHGKTGCVYHIASGNPVTMREILIRYLTTHKIDVEVVHEASELTNRSGYDVPIIYADMRETMRLMKDGGISADA